MCVSAVPASAMSQTSVSYGRLGATIHCAALPKDCRNSLATADRNAVGCPAAPRLQQLVAQVRDTPVQALLVQSAFVREPQVVANLVLERLVRKLDLLSPVQQLNRLLGTERDEHAQHDDADFLDKLAPTVHGMLWAVDLHGER